MKDNFVECLVIFTAFIFVAYVIMSTHMLCNLEDAYDELESRVERLELAKGIYHTPWED